MSERKTNENTAASPLETAVTIVQGEAGKQPEASAAPPQDAPVTEVTIAYDPPKEAPHDTRTMLLTEPPVSSGYVPGDELQPGDRLDRYTVVRKLGQGGMGSVYLVRHETLGVFRALKVLSGALCRRGGEFVDRFLREARMACSISNPNIVNVLDVGEDPDRGLCYIVMEYVDGGTVRDVLRNTPRLGEIDAVIIAGAVAEALEAAAEQKIVHRDIKPDNIMLTKRGEVKLADLGIAKNNDENVQLTRSHIMMGTPAYLAPEQAMDAHAVDVRADIYSLGATLYEMLTGAIPYPGKSTYDILAKLASAPVPDPRNLADTVSPQTARLVMRMLAKQPKHRPADASELLREIRALDVVPPDLDPQQNIRELLKNSGAGKYSPGSSTPTTGDPVSTWLMRHFFLRCENFLRRIPLLAETAEFLCRKPLFFYIFLAVVSLLAAGIPLALSRNTPASDAELRRVGTESGPGETPGNSSSAAVKMPEVSLPESKAPEPRRSTKTPDPGSPAPAARAPEKKESAPAPEVKPRGTKIPLPASNAKSPEKRTSASDKGRALPGTPRKNIPTFPAKAADEKITFPAEISPAGANVILRDEKGRQIASTAVPANGRIKFSVPEGQYVLQVSAPGFQSAEREFPVSRNRTVTGVKIALRQNTLLCTMAFYGNVKLLEFLRKEGVEVRIDNGVWKKVTHFPHGVEVSRRPHTIFLRGKGILPQEQRITPSAEQKRCAVEFYLTEKDALLEFSSSVGNPVQINVSGLWEPLKKHLPVPAFRSMTLKWRVAGTEEEEILEIPELPPESLRKITLRRKPKTVFPGAAEFSEARKLLEAGNNREAVEKLRKAEAEGHPEALYLLGTLAEEGKGRWFASDKEALEYYRKAAAPPVSDPRAQYKIGQFCEQGRGGLEREMKTALEWYRKAAARKDPDAMLRLGFVFRDGDGGEAVDYQKMIAFFTAAAEAGRAEAQFQLGYCCENGIGLPINVSMARHWYDKAAAQGHDNARRRGKALESIRL